MRFWIKALTKWPKWWIKLNPTERHIIVIFQKWGKSKAPTGFYKEKTDHIQRFGDQNGFRLLKYIHSAVLCLVMSDSLRPHGLKHAGLPCPSLSPRVFSNSCPLSRWCHPTISSSVVPFSHLRFFPASGSFQLSQLFASGGQSIGASASLISLQSKGLSRVFSNTTVQKHQFFGAQLSL